MALSITQIDEAKADALEWAADRYEGAQIAAAMPILDAFHWQVLERLLTASESSEGFHARERAKIEKAIGSIDFDIGPDGEPK